MNNPVLLEMYLPAFREGYTKGRKLYFQGATPTNDLSLLDILVGLAEEGAFQDARDEGMAYTIGQLMGSISCNVIGQQEGEPGPKEREARCLATLRHELAASPHLDLILSLVQSMWSAQDELARLLSESLYEQIQNRGATFPIMLQ